MTDGETSSFLVLQESRVLVNQPANTRGYIDFLMETREALQMTEQPVVLSKDTENAENTDLLERN